MKMLDSAFEPNDSQVRDAIAQGYRLWAGYLPSSPGWGVYHVWSDAGWAVVKAHPGEMTPVGVFFGPRADLAVQQAQARGINVVALDIEASDQGTYAPQWGDAVRSSGLWAVIYGLPRTIDAYRAHFDALWYAIPGWSGVPGSRTAVQCGQTNIQGLNCDWSICADDFVPGISGGNQPMTPDERASIGRALARLALRHTNSWARDEPPADEVVAYGNNVAQGQDFDLMIASILDSDDGKAFANELADLVAWQAQGRPMPQQSSPPPPPPPSSTTVPPHRHALPGGYTGDVVSSTG